MIVVLALMAVPQFGETFVRRKCDNIQTQVSGTGVASNRNIRAVCFVISEPFLTEAFPILGREHLY
jgi:hypothetical protein